MKKTLFITFTIIFSLNIHSQHTENFLDLTKSLKPIDSSTIISKYKNGNPKEIANYIKYKFGDYTYEFISGLYRNYLKDGTIFFEQKFDRFGNLLIQRQINDKGEVYNLIKTEKIDTKSKSLKDFLDSKKSLLIYTKQYMMSENTGELFLWQERQELGGKKIGVWKTYNQCDEKVQLKDYSE